MTTLYGVDGCKGGWLVSRSVPDGDALGIPSFSVTTDLRHIFEKAIQCQAIAIIDVPIGLCDAGARNCDLAARKILRRPRSSSVFPPPFRRTLQATTYRKACELNCRDGGPKVTQQTFNIMKGIRDVDGLITPKLQNRVREAHPEVTFAQLAGSPMKFRKRTVPGIVERLAVLAANGVNLTRETIQSERLRLGRSLVKPDDIVDAAACLVTAWRVYRKAYVVIPNSKQVDAEQLRMEIVS